MLRLQLGPAQVEHPVPEPQFLGGELLALLPRHRNGGRHGRARPCVRARTCTSTSREAMPASRADLGAQRHVALDQHHRLRARPTAARAITSGGRPARIAGELHEAGAVAQVDEDEAAEVAAAVHPAAEADALADVFAA